MPDQVVPHRGMHRPLSVFNPYWSSAAVNTGRALGRWMGSKRKRVDQSGSRRPKKGEKSPAGTTFQRDIEYSYVRRRAPRRVKRRARKWAARVNKIIFSDLAVNTFQRRTTQILTSAADKQGLMSCSLYGASGGFATIHDDVDKIFSATGTSTALRSAKLNFSNAYMELTITNLSALGQFIDMYYFVCRRDVPATMGASPHDVFFNALTLQPNTYGSALAANDLGVTPFDANRFCTHFIITKVVRHQLSPGSNISLTMRDRKDYKITGSDINTVSFIKGKSRGILFICEGAIQGTAIQAPVNLSFEWTRLYHVQIPRENVTTIQNI